MFPSVALAARRLLPLFDALAAPHGAERYLEQINPLWSLDRVRARIVGLRRETADALTLCLRPNRHWQGFEAGQYLRLEVEVEGVRRSRCYSLSSSAHRRDGLIEVTVKRQDGGRVSPWIESRLRLGDVVNLSQAEGDFVLLAQRPPHLLLIGGGSGITPLMSMLRTLHDEHYDGRVQLLYYVRSAADAIFAAELASLAGRHPQWSLTTLCTREPGVARFGADALRRHAPDYADAQAYVCGPASLIAAAEALWREGGRSQALHVERFVAGPAVVPSDAVAGDIVFARSERYAANDGRSLLEQAEAAGLRPDSGCRMGICHSCTCRKSAGAVRNLRTGLVSTEAGEDIQLCVSVALGDVTLDL